MKRFSQLVSFSNDHMTFEKHFHWLVPQTVATQVAGQMLRLRDNKKKFVAASRDTLPKLKLISTSRNKGDNKNVA